MTRERKLLLCPEDHCATTKNQSADRETTETYKFFIGTSSRDATEKHP